MLEKSDDTRRSGGLRVINTSGKTQCTGVRWGSAHPKEGDAEVERAREVRDDTYGTPDGFGADD